MLRVIKNIYHKLCRWLSIKNITWLTAFIFLIILLPLFYCSFVNRASGDDYGYGTLTRAAWIGSHSIIAVIKAAWQTIINYYYGWQGTWFSIFLFTLQPEVFHEKAYVIVVFLMLFLWIGSTFLLFRKLLKDKLKYDNCSVNLITILFLGLCISFIPRKKSAIFWYNGCAHYMIPFVMCQLLVYWLLQYKDTYKKRYLIGITLFMFLLGGANYQSALFGLIVAVYFLCFDFYFKRNGKILFLTLPILLEILGLIISMKAPGNAVRGGEDFELSVSRAIGTIFQSFVLGLKDIGDYVQQYPMVFVGLLAMFWFMLEAVKIRGVTFEIKYWKLFLVAMFCLYSAMQAPAIYAGVEVSGGVYNTNFQVFMLMSVIILGIFAEKLGDKLRKYENTIWKEMHKKMVIPGLGICVVLGILCRSDIKETTTWMCVDYVITGQAKDYKMQMEQLTKLMSDPEIQDVVVPFINDFQGPLMHMPVTEDKTAWTNTVICEYYRKKSVIAIPRPEWEEKYQK